MFCTQCGKQNSENSQYCYNCGNILRGAPGGESPNHVQPQIQYVYITGQNNEQRDTSRSFSVHPCISGIVFSFLLVISCFLPFIESKWGENSENFFNLKPGYGIAAFICALVALIFSIINKKAGIILPGLGGIITIIIQLVYWVEKMKDWTGRYAKTKEIIDAFFDFYKFQAGFWGVIICSIALIICGAISENYSHYDETKENDTNRYLSKLRDEENSTGSWICFACGAKNAMYIGTCKCGNNKSDSRNMIQKPTVKKSGNTVARCPSCGWLVGGDRVSCTYCGARLIK